MKKFIACVTLLSGLLCFMYGCSTSSGNSITESQPLTSTLDTETENQETQKLVPLNIGYNPDYCCAWVLTTAKSMGYFEEEGFDVTLYEFSSGPEQVSAMESGTLDIVSIGTGAHKLAATGSCTIFCFSHLSDAERVMGLASHGVTSLEDLQGKKVGYASGTASETILLTALSSVGLTLEDIEAYDMDTSSLATAMISGTIDACATWSPNDLTIMEELGEDAQILAKSSDYTDVYVGPLSFAVSNEYAQENHEQLVALTRALYKAKDYAAVEQNRGNVAEFVAEQCDLDYDAIYAQRYDGDFISGEQTYQYAVDGTLRDYYELYETSAIESGAIEKEQALELDDFIDFSVMIEAGETLYGPQG